MRVIGGRSDRLDLYASMIVKGSAWSEVIRTQAFGGGFCTILHRSYPFQAELCVFPGGMDIPEHRHPDVETIEYQVSGNLELTVNGNCVTDRVNTLLRKSLGFRIPRNAVHSVRIGKEGCAFLSIQEWFIPEIDHIGHNWEGVAYSGDQASRLGHV